MFRNLYLVLGLLYFEGDGLDQIVAYFVIQIMNQSTICLYSVLAVKKIWKEIIDDTIYLRNMDPLKENFWIWVEKCHDHKVLLISYVGEFGDQETQQHLKKKIQNVSCSCNRILGIYKEVYKA